MAAVNVTLASVTSENTNSTIDSLIIGVINDQESAAGSFGLPINGGPTPSGPLTASSSNIAATAYGIPNEPFAANQQQLLPTDSAVVDARTCTPGQQQPYNHTGSSELPARIAVVSASASNSSSSVSNFVDPSSASVCTTPVESSSLPIPPSVLSCAPLAQAIRPFISVAVASSTGVKTDATTIVSRPPTPSNSLHALVAAPRVRINAPGVVVSQTAQQNSSVASVPANFRTLAPRIVVNSSQMPTILRVQQPSASHAVAMSNQQNVVLPIRTTQGQLVNRPGGLTLSGGMPLPQNVFFVKNEQTGQVMMVQGQPPMLPTAQGNQVIQPSIRLQPSSSAATLRPVSSIAGSNMSSNIPGGLVGVIGSPSPANQQVQSLRVQTPLGGRLTLPIQQSTGVQLMQQPMVSSSVMLSQSAVASRLIQPANVMANSTSIALSTPNGLIHTTSPVTTPPTPGSGASKDMLDNVRKCKNFLSTLLKLASNQPPATVQNVKNLIQGLVDGNVEPEDFTTRLQKELKSSPQPYLVPFLKKSLPLLRHSLSLNRMHIEGVRPPQPSLNVPQSVAIMSSSASGNHMLSPLSSGTMPVLAQQLHPVVGGLAVPGMRPTTSTMGPQQALSLGAGRALVPNFNSLTLQQRQALIAAQQQQQRMLAESSRQLLTRPAALAGLQTVGGAPTGMPLAARVAFTSNGPTTVLPSLRGVIPRPTLTTSASGPPATTAGANSLSSTVHKAEKRKYDSLRDDDDINDVAAMGGVNLIEESRNILAANSELVSGQLRSCKEETFFDSQRLLARIAEIARRNNVTGTIPQDVVRLISHATQERLRTILEKLSVLTEHRVEVYKTDSRYEITSEVKSQMKFLAELESLERKRHEEVERGVLMRAAKSRAKLEDPEQLKLKEKAKAMQQAEMEEVRQREANMTALAAIGPRRQKRLENMAAMSSAAVVNEVYSGSTGVSRSSSVALRPRVKRVCLKDLVFVLEEERETRHSPLIYKALLK